MAPKEPTTGGRGRRWTWLSSTRCPRSNPTWGWPKGEYDPPLEKKEQTWVRRGAKGRRRGVRSPEAPPRRKSDIPRRQEEREATGGPGARRRLA